MTGQQGDQSLQRLTDVGSSLKTLVLAMRMAKEARKHRGRFRERGGASRASSNHASATVFIGSLPQPVRTTVKVT